MKMLFLSIPFLLLTSDEKIGFIVNTTNEEIIKILESFPDLSNRPSAILISKNIAFCLLVYLSDADYFEYFFIKDKFVKLKL
jgi:hypothetical protein